METYCLVCKKLTKNNNNIKKVKNNGRLMIKSNCSVCNNKNSRFISQGSGLLV